MTEKNGSATHRLKICNPEALKLKPLAIYYKSIWRQAIDWGQK